MVAGRENSGWPPGLEGEAGPGGGVGVDMGDGQEGLTRVARCTSFPFELSIAYSSANIMRYE